MKLGDWLEKSGMTSLTIKAGFLDMEWDPKDPDRKAAWELNVELLTRVATRYLSPEHGACKTPEIHRDTCRHGGGRGAHSFGWDG